MTTTNLSDFKDKVQEDVDQVKSLTMSKYTTEIIIPSYMVDKDRLLKPVDLMKLLQDLAMEGAEKFGFGHSALDPQEEAWVLSRIHIQFNEMPHWQDRVRMETWHKGLDGLYFLRDYRMNDLQGKEMVRASSSWVVIQGPERKFVRSDRLLDIIPAQGQSEDEAIATPTPKLRIPAGLEKTLVKPYRVHYSDIDFVGHANNTRYLEWILDSLPSVIPTQHALKELIINYHQESQLDEELEIVLYQENGSLRFWAEVKAQNSLLLNAFLSFA